MAPLDQLKSDRDALLRVIQKMDRWIALVEALEATKRRRAAQPLSRPPTPDNDQADAVGRSKVKRKILDAIVRGKRLRGREIVQAVQALGGSDAGVLTALGQLARDGHLVRTGKRGAFEYQIAHREASPRARKTA